MTLHDWKTDDTGSIDEFRFNDGSHNGPECRRCGVMVCHQCEEGVYEQACPAANKPVMV